ncbi:hypothetical protein OGR47_00900 [Methylocystis sp. MJC1]|uniref:hypothetical protein n=1 Tax=Methylocystis sp. MJC1 TaxID=2654282 RepID=UPI0013ED5FF3|nr:hypothetical protein [Methylocystis sp. MJC1]MBU6525576.1 hypothetical protein [Methylocystis sp. MJC1]UZX12054.1 hypothetical protein OGR47_00900 [Methylocystis sp. MJC1]
MSEFIARRREELAEEERKLRRRLSEILIEMQQLKSVASQHFESEEKIDRQLTPRTYGRKRSIKPGTIMFDVMAILDGYPQGLTANEILDRINEIRTERVERTSLSPQLSRLRQDGYLELAGSVWRLIR